MFSKQIPDAVKDFLATCEDADVLRYVNQALLMPQLQKTYAKRIDLYRDNLNWGDLAFVPWGDRKTYLCMVWALVDEHRVQVAWIEEGQKSPEIHTVDTKMLSSVVYTSGITNELGTDDAEAWKAAVLEAIDESQAINYNDAPVRPKNMDYMLSVVLDTILAGDE